MKLLLVACMLFVAGGAASAPMDTVTVTVYVGNRMGLVIDTETLVLSEESETTGRFQSGSVMVTDRAQAKGDPNEIDANPVNQNSPDFAEVPDVAHFVEVNASLIALVVAAVLVGILMWVMYRRWFGAHAAARLANMPEEEILNQDWIVLSNFCRLYPDHPSAPLVAMELGRRFYESLEYKKAVSFFEQAVRLGRGAKNPEAHFYLADSLRHLDYVCDAIDEWMACYMDDPHGPLAQKAFREAQRWRAYQIVRDKEECPQCGAECRLTEMRCRRCDADLKRTLVQCGVCGKMMVKEAQICIHCLPDDIKAEVAAGTDWPILKTTMIDWEAELIKSRLASDGIPCVLTGEKGCAIPLNVGHLGEIHIRVPISNLSDAQQIVAKVRAESGGPESSEDADFLSVPPDVESSPSVLPGVPPRPEERGLFLRLMKGIFIIAMLVGIGWLFYEMGDLVVVSTVDGEKIRERDVGVSIHDPAVFEPGRPVYLSKRKENARLLRQQKLEKAEAVLLRKHLASAGDTGSAAMDDMSLLDWGRVSGRIVRK